MRHDEIIMRKRVRKHGPEGWLKLQRYRRVEQPTRDSLNPTLHPTINFSAPVICFTFKQNCRNIK